MNGLFYVHQYKPDFCELFIICGGKQVSPRVNNGEITMEDGSGVKVAKMRDKTNFIDWIEKVFCDKTIDSNERVSSRSSTSSTNLEAHLDQNQWEFYVQEINNYFQELLSLNFEGENCEQEFDDDSCISPIDAYVQQLKNSDDKVTKFMFDIKKFISAFFLLGNYLSFYWILYKPANEECTYRSQFVPRSENSHVETVLFGDS
jgi:hypothetical protein